MAEPRLTSASAKSLAGTITRERVALALLAAVASARALVSIAPALRFDSDPAIVPGAFAGLGPSGSLLLDALGAAAIAFLAAARLRASRADPSRSAGATTALLLLLPLPAFLLVLLSPGGSFADLWRGATWFVAALAAVSIAGSDRAGRAIVLGALAGAAAAMLLRGASQLLVEHPAMVAEFERSRDAFLASRGWTPGSAAALAYERRLRQPEASGWFGLANVYSGAMVAATLLFSSLAWATRRAQSLSSARRVAPFAGAICAALAIGATITVLINGSKGAIAVLIIGCAAFALLVFMSRESRMSSMSHTTRASPMSQTAHTTLQSGESSDGARRWIPRLLVLLLFLAPFVVFVRGAILGETSMAERSLLFRWHYVLGSLRTLVESPLSGVGVGGFQDAYTRMRIWMSPEEVVSAHSIALDWLAAFGIGGVAVIAIVIMLLVRALRAPFEPPLEQALEQALDTRTASAPATAPAPATAASADLAQVSAAGPAPALMAAGSAGLGAALAMALTSSTDLSAESMGLRLLALVAAVVVALVAARIVEAGERRLVDAGAAAAALALLVHAQIDMSFWLPGSVWWCWLLVGAAAAGARPVRRAFDRIALALTGAGAMAAALALGVMSVRAGVQERTAEHAALQIEAAAAAGAPLPRLEASHLLADVADVIPGNTVVWQAAIEQSILSVDQLPLAESGARLARLLETRDFAEAALAARPELMTMRLVADVRLREAIEWRRSRSGTIVPGPDVNAPEADAALIASIRAVLERDPRSLPMWRRLVEAQRLIGDATGAAESATRALEVNASYALDPLRQLSTRDRAALERAIASPSSLAPPPR